MDFFRNSSAPQQKKIAQGHSRCLTWTLDEVPSGSAYLDPKKYGNHEISKMDYICFDMDYDGLCIIFYFCSFHISMYGFHVWLVISGYIHKSEGNLDHMLNGTMKSLTNPGCFMKLLNHPGRSVFKKKSVKHYLRQSKWLYNPICSMYGMFTNI